jgi:membrane protease YdiL (CAAX protease family)
LIVDRVHDRRLRGSPLGFFLLVLVLSVPFWLIGAYAGTELLPGLPVSALQFVCPAIAAVVLVRRTDGFSAVGSLLRRSIDSGRIGAKAWWVPVLLLMPGATVLAYGLMRLAGSPLPSPQFPAPAVVLAMFLAFFASALAEELGWSGYATDPMQARWGALGAAVLLGLVWAAFHYVPLLQADRAATWIGWWCLYTVAIRVLIVWIYNNVGKSVLAAAVFHATTNLTWQLFPNQGSHWDPALVGSIVGLAAVSVSFLWGPKTLARFRYGS